MFLAKSRWAKFPEDPVTGKPSYCADTRNSAWTIESNNEGMNQPMLILCPRSFTRKSIYNSDIPDQLDLAPQEPGKVLDAMEPRMLAFYHELFHVVSPPSKLLIGLTAFKAFADTTPARGVERSPDAQYRPAKKGKDGNPVPS